MQIFLFLFICLLKNIFNEEEEEIIFDINPIIEKINKNSINSADSKKIIEETKILMNEYPFINILKDPPTINGDKKYFKKVDIIKELDELQSDFEKNPINFYQYYQRYLKIIRQTNDSHISFTYKGEIDYLKNIVVFSPFEIIIDEDKKLFLSPNSLFVSSEIRNIIPGFETIIKKADVPIKTINSINPFEFIRNFCKDYFTYKNKNAKFTFTKNVIENKFNLSTCPMDSEEFNLIIEYIDDTIVNTNFIGINTKIIYNNKNYEYLMKFIKIENENQKNGILTNRKLLKDYLKSKSNKTSFRKIEEEKINWDLNLTNIKCRVDNKNKVNVYYQNSFKIKDEELSDNDLITLLIKCQYNFLNNDYPIVVIEDGNGGGLVKFSMLFQEIVQNLFNNQLKCSIKIGNYTKLISDYKGLFFDFLKENGDHYENTDEFLKDFTIDKLSEGIENKRLKQRPFYIHYAQFYKDLIIRNKYKKPTEIIIYTDGFSFSATSLFIKSLYHFGGAIIVGYNGDPETEKKDFDASQSPTFVLPLRDFMETPIFSTLKKYGFIFNQISYGPSYKNQFIEGNLDYPEEFQVTPVDERIDIYNAYDDSLYQSFIEKAKKIFKKYNEEGKCNPDNKNLKMLSKECDKEFDSVTHGGYECGKDGKWTKKCKPFYCHKNYYFDYVNEKCVKDVFPEKYSMYYSNESEYDEKDKEIKELKNKVDDLDGDVSKYKGLFIFLLVVIILIALIALFFFLKIKYGINIFKHNEI